MSGGPRDRGPNRERTPPRKGGQRRRRCHGVYFALDDHDPVVATSFGSRFRAMPEVSAYVGDSVVLLPGLAVRFRP